MFSIEIHTATPYLPSYISNRKLPPSHDNLNYSMYYNHIDFWQLRPQLLFDCQQ